MMEYFRSLEKKVTLEMMTHDNKQTDFRGRERGLVSVWEEERREKIDYG